MNPKIHEPEDSSGSVVLYVVRQSAVCLAEMRDKVCVGRVTHSGIERAGELFAFGRVKIYDYRTAV